MKTKNFFIAVMAMLLLAGCANSNADSRKDSGDLSTDTTTSETTSTQPVGELNTVTISVSDLSDGYEWENGVKYNSFKLDTVTTVTSSGGANTGKYYSSDNSYRLYAAENATLTISVSENHSLKSISISYKGKENGAIEGLKSEEAKEVSGNSVTLTPISTTGSKGKVFITSFTVSYYGEKGEAPFTPRTNWKQEELDLLDQYAYGVTVPFIQYKGISIVYDEFGLYVQADNADLALTKQFIDAFEESEVWVNLDEELPENDANFIASIDTDAGERFVTANIYVVDDEGDLVTEDTAKGTFYIDLVDPFYYAWDDNMMTELLTSISSSVTLPEVEDISYFAVTELEELEGYALYLYNQEETALAAYKNKVSEWTISEETEASFKAMPISEDLILEVSYEEGMLVLQLIKHLPKLDAYPAAEVAEYLEGIVLPSPACGQYFTKEYVDQTTEFMGMEYVIRYLEVKAYGVSQDEFDVYDGLFAGEEFTKGDGYVSYYDATTLLTATFSYSFDAENGVITMQFDPVEKQYESASWSDVALKFQEEWLTAKGLSVTLPELTAPEGERFIFSSMINEPGYYDCFEIMVKGNMESAWLEILKGVDYTIPETAGDYGYECIDPNGILEIDVMYESESGYTLANIYSYADFAE